MNQIIAGLYGSLEAAGRAQAALVLAGVADRRICVSRSLTEDGIAAEAPGQSYENQNDEDSASAKFTDAVLGAVCVVSVKVMSRGEAALAAAVLRNNGARGGVLRLPNA